MRSIVSFLILAFLAGCAGGTSSGGGVSPSTYANIIGFALANEESTSPGTPGTTFSNAVYSDGSIKTVSQVTSGVNLQNFSVAKEGTQYFVYGADDEGSAIVAYSVNTTTGALTVLPNTSLSSGASYCLVDHLNQYLYVGLANGTLISFAIDSATGALTQTSYSLTLQSGYMVYAMVEDTPAQHFVVGVGLSGGSSLYGGYYVLTDTQNGNPTLDYQDFTTSEGRPNGFVADPGTQNGDFVFGGTLASGNFVSINVTKLAAGNANGIQYFNVTGTGNPTIAYWADPTGTWFYGGIDNNTSSNNQTGTSLYQYTISQTGSLARGNMAPVPFGIYFQTQAASYDPKNGVLVGPGGGSISTFTFSLSGNLTYLKAGGNGVAPAFAYIPSI